jgi:hypothetical protein
MLAMKSLLAFTVFALSSSFFAGAPPNIIFILASDPAGTKNLWTEMTFHFHSYPESFIAKRLYIAPFPSFVP